MSILDDVAEIARIDRGGMHEHMLGFPNHLFEALEIGRSADLRVRGDDVRSVVVLGMGGSAIGGELASGLLAGEIRVPMEVVRGYDVPAYVSSNTLALVSSYSGNTEETLSAYEQATQRGAKVVCTTSGGRVRELASERGHDVITIPGGLPPRAALAFSLVPMLVTLSRLGLAEDPTGQVEDAVDACRENVARCSLEVPEPDNPAKQVAGWLHGHIPVVYGSAPRTGVVATRWAGQLSENSKTVAHVNVLPEMNHNEIVGWSGAEPLVGRARVVFLRDSEDSDRIARRIDITYDEVTASGCEARSIESFGATRLGRMLSLVSVGDFVSLYLACLYGVDPTPVAPIDRLKKALS